MALVFTPSDGLGNILFQHHAAYSFAREHNLELCAPGYYYDIRPKFSEYAKLFRHVKILGQPEEFEPTQEYMSDPQMWRIRNALRHGAAPNAVYVEPMPAYSPIPDGARVLSGYFQSWKYFDKFRIEIRDLLKSNEKELWESQKERYKGGVCVHVRWGGDGLDPKLKDILPPAPVEYYTKAVEMFPGSKFLVFCEDPNLVKDWDLWKGKDVEIINEPSPLATLFLMSCCEHFIIPNSTLSLGAYYLRDNDGAKLVAPKNWFGSKVTRYSLADIVGDATII